MSAAPRYWYRSSIFSYQYSVEIVVIYRQRSRIIIPLFWCGWITPVPHSTKIGIPSTVVLASTIHRSIFHLVRPLRVPCPLLLAHPPGCRQPCMTPMVDTVPFELRGKVCSLYARRVGDMLFNRRSHLSSHREYPISMFKPNCTTRICYCARLAAPVGHPIDNLLISALHPPPQLCRSMIATLNYQ
jgi:hypothetical protein